MSGQTLKLNTSELLRTQSKGSPSYKNKPIATFCETTTMHIQGQQGVVLLLTQAKAETHQLKTLKAVQVENGMCFYCASGLVGFK